MTTQQAFSNAAIPLDERWQMDGEDGYTPFPVYTLHTTRCSLGWSIFFTYCRAWQEAATSREDLPQGHPWRTSLESSSERALEAHRVHQTTCPQCAARNEELADLGDA